jgi:hypothetical protein
MPHALHDLWLANVEGMSRLLCASVHDTLVELRGDAKSLGARPGIIATRHTWSQTLLLHPHLHGLVTGGGLNAAGEWVAVRHGTGHTRTRPGVRRLRSMVRSVGSPWCAQPSCLAQASPRQPTRVGSRWHEREHGRGRSAVAPERTRAACRRAHKGPGVPPMAPRLPWRLRLGVPTTHTACQRGPRGCDTGVGHASNLHRP